MHDSENVSIYTLNISTGIQSVAGNEHWRYKLLNRTKLTL